MPPPDNIQDRGDLIYHDQLWLHAQSRHDLYPAYLASGHIAQSILAVDPEQFQILSFDVVRIVGVKVFVELEEVTRGPITRDVDLFGKIGDLLPAFPVIKMRLFFFDLHTALARLAKTHDHV